jgi:hypothetical protein
VALALALTALVRRSLPSAPLGAITAPVMASGKTLLADAIAIRHRRSAPAMKYADKEEEFTKTMLAVLAEGDQVVLIDNVERPLQGETLCMAITSEAYRQRVLGKTEMMNAPTTSLFLATGNHLVVAGDLRTRTLPVSTRPETERPERRQFDRELRTWMLEHRAELVAAGSPSCALHRHRQRPQDFCDTWGRFEHWSEMVRAPLIWLGCADPAPRSRAWSATTRSASSRHDPVGLGGRVQDEARTQARPSRRLGARRQRNRRFTRRCCSSPRTGSTAVWTRVGSAIGYASTLTA